MYGMPIEDALNLILDELKRLKALEDELIILKEKVNEILKLSKPNIL